MVVQGASRWNWCWASTSRRVPAARFPFRCRPGGERSNRSAASDFSHLLPAAIPDLIPATQIPVPLLDLRAQHDTIRDEVIPGILSLVEEQRFILGEAVAKLEREVAELSDTRYAVGCASGTDALLLALRALDVGRDDEVVTTPFTFFATAGTIHNVGARPVFVDIEPRSFNISPEAVTAAVTSRTRAVVPVDLFGQMAPLEAVKQAAGGLPVIEDAAQSIGARRRIGGSWTPAGAFATI